MKKLIFSIIVTAILITSCNFPLTQPTKNSSSLVATRVAQTLAALPNATSMPTSGPVPTNALPTVALSTITPTEAATITPTNTPPPPDIKTTLGTPAYLNSFTSSSGFDLAVAYIDDAVNLSIHDGVMDYVSLAVNHGKRWRLTYPTPRDFYLEGTFQTTNCSGFDQYGLVSRAPNYFDGFGYYIAFSCNGQFIVQKWDSGGTSTVIGWTPDTHILSGSEQTNRLGVWVKGSNFELYANGVMIKAFSDSSLSAGGHFGIYGNAVETSNFSFKVEEIAQWDLP